MIAVLIAWPLEKNLLCQREKKTVLVLNVVRAVLALQVKSAQEGNQDCQEEVE